MKTTKQVILSFSALATLFFVACAKERQVKDIIPNGRRVLKTNFQGVHLYQKTVTDVQYASRNFPLPQGYYLESEKLIEFKINEKTLDIVSVDPLWMNDRPARANNVLASFPVKHVDVLRKQNADNQDTHEVEETETRRPWQEREYLIIDPTGDAVDEFLPSTDTSSTPDNIDIDTASGAINMKVARTLKDNTQVSERYSFLKFTPNPNYVQREYPVDMRTKFGYFPTVTYKFDTYGRVTYSDMKVFMNRWDTSKKIIYYLSANFPEHLKPAAREVFASWNEAFKAATGKDTLEVRENSGQEIGDLRYSMIIYDPTPDTNHGILGYGPSVANPRTGEIIKGDVILYGGALRSTVYRERIWEIQLGSFNPIPTRNGMRPAGTRAVPGPLPFREVLATSIPSNGTRLDRDTVNSIRKDFSIEKMASLAREASFPARMANALKRDSHMNIKENYTELGAEIAAAIHHADFKKMNDNELEIAIFKPLLAHELGHNMGLRHNFMASFDGRHFENGKKSSSVMDYGWLSSHEPPSPGRYDKAALVIAYSGNEAAKANLLNDNYYYCTDEHTLSPEHMACNRFDAGTSLTKVGEALGRRYYASWLFNNLRLDRVHMSSMKDYLQRVSLALIQIRFMYDHAHTTLNVMQELDPANPQPSLVNLWRLAHQRIEPDNESDPKNVLTIRVPTKISVIAEDGKLVARNQNIERKVDITKVIGLRNDAQEAKDLAFETLAGVLLNENRPLYSGGDLVEHETQIRGVIYDKLFSILYMGMGTPDPLGRGTVVSIFNTESSGIMRDLFTSLLSNTPLFEVPGQPRFEGYDINIREFAFNLFTNEIAQASGTELSRTLVGVQKVTLQANSPERLALLAQRQQVRNLMKDLLRGNLTRAQQQAKEADLAKLEANLAQYQGPVIAATGEQDQYLRSTVQSRELGFSTASGRLIRDNINPFEDILSAILDIREEARQELAEELKKPETAPPTLPNPTEILLNPNTEITWDAVVRFLPPNNPVVALQDAKKVEALKTKIANLTERIAIFNRVIAQNLRTLDRFHKFYEFGTVERSDLF